MAEENSQKQHNPTAEDLAGVTIIIEGEEDFTIRQRQIPPQQLPPVQPSDSGLTKPNGEE